MKVRSTRTTTMISESRVRKSSHRRRAPRLFCASLIAVAGAMHVQSAFAMDRYVDSAGGIDVGNCITDTSPCRTIAYAISNAGSGDAIQLISVAGGGNVYNEWGLTIPFDLTVKGMSSSLSVIDAGGNDRIFTVNGGHLTLDNVTLRSGVAPAGGSGGAVRLVTGDLTVQKSLVMKNVALLGGAIAAENTAGTVKIIGSKFLYNRATASGGGIHCDACNRVVIARSAISESTAGAQGGAVYAQSTDLRFWFSELRKNNADDGGAIYANSAEVAINDSELRDNEADQGDGGGIFSAGNLSIQRSTLSGNSAYDNGGGVFLFGEVSLATSNSTFSGNDAVAGGAILMAGNFPNPNPTALVSNSTFVDNESTFPGQGHHISGAWTSFSLSNSILHLSPALQATNDVCIGPVTTGAANLIDDVSCNYGGAAFNFGAASGLTTTLAGGTPRTHAIAATSNAVDTAFTWLCNNTKTGFPLIYDQRRQARPVDGDLSGTIECDIGAYEVQ